MTFENAPFWVRQASVFGLGIRNRAFRYRGDFKPTLDFLERSAGWSTDEQRAWQRDRLIALVETARNGSPYYQSVLANIDLSRLHSASLSQVLALLPVLKKETLKQDSHAFLNKDFRRFSASSTSGSTGAPTRVEHDLRSIQRRFAFQSDHLRQLGVGLLDPSVRLSGRIIAAPGNIVKKPWVYNAAERQLFVSSYHLDENHANALIRRMEQLKPTVIDGYPSAILQLARLVSGRSRALSYLKAVVTTAETLQPESREDLETMTGVPVLDYYSASEGLPLVQQCSEGVYHVRWQSGILEVFTPDGVAEEGDGEIVATSFVQDRTPLIRYRTGDLVRGLRQNDQFQCACGWSSPTVEGVLGRVEDLIYMHDGRALGMFTYRTLKYVDGLQESQVIQHDYDRFQLRAVFMPGFDVADVSNAVKASFERVLGYEIQLDVDPVNVLPKGAGGKVRLVISHVANKTDREDT